MMIRLLAILFAVQCASASLSFDCRYTNHGWVALNNVYTCTPRVTMLGNSRNVVGVSQNHMSGRNNLDVRGVNFQNQNVLTFIPLDMNRFFPNLEGILFNECPIRSFTREDLRPFTRLRDFSIHRGALTTVSGDVFQHAPGLQFANLGRNEIANVGPGIFQGTRVTEARFNHNWCIGTQARTSAQVANLVTELAFRCPPTVEMTERFILSGANFQRAVNDQVEPELRQLREENRRAHERIDALEGIIRNLCTIHSICF